MKIFKNPLFNPKMFLFNRETKTDFIINREIEFLVLYNNYNYNNNNKCIKFISSKTRSRNNVFFLIIFVKF